MVAFRSLLEPGRWVTNVSALLLLTGRPHQAQPPLRHSQALSVTRAAVLWATEFEKNRLFLHVVKFTN